MKSVKTNFIYNSLYQILAIIIPLITTPYISRILGSEKIGVYSYSFAIVTYFSLFVLLGLNNYGNRTIASVRNNKRELSNSFFEIYAFQLICGLIVSVAYLIYTFRISANPQISIIFYLYLLGSILDINWFFWGIEEFKLTTIRNAAIKILSTVSIFAFVRTAEDLKYYCAIISVSYLISQIYLWIVLRKYVSFFMPSIEGIKKHIKPNLFLFITVILVSLFKIMDKIMLGMISDYSEVGFYESSEKVIAVPTAIITALGAVMLPRSTFLFSNNKADEAKRYLKKSIVFAMLISTSLCFGLMSISKDFVPLFYGDGFDKCIVLYIVLLPSCIFLAFANVIRTQYLLPNKMDRSYILSALIGAIVNIIINLALIPLFGSIGAAIGTLCAEFAVCFYQVYAVKKQLPVIVYLKSAVPFIISGVIMFITLYFLISLPIENAIILLAVKIFIGAITYFFVLLLLSFLFRRLSGEKLIDFSGILSHKKTD